MLNLVQALHELICERLDPFNILLFHLDESLANVCFPFGYEMNVWRVLLNHPGDVFLYFLEVFQITLVRTINVLQVFLCNKAFQALIAL